MDLGDLGPPQDLGHQDGTPKEGGKERGGGGGGTTRGVAEGGDGRGRRDMFRAGGRREAAICLPWRLPEMQAGVSQGCSSTKLLISSVKRVGCRTLSQAGFICPGCSDSS